MPRAKKQKNEQNTGTITSERLSQITGYTDVWHRQAAKAGYFAPPVNGRYKTVPTLQGLFRRERDLREKSKSPLVAERQKKLKAQRELLELQLAQARRESLNAKEVEKTWQGITMTVRQRLLSLPSRLAPRLIYCPNQQAMAAEIEKDLNQILSGLSQE